MWGGEPRHDVPNPYMMCEAPTWRSRRLMVTERGISYRGRPPRKRSSQSNREGHVSKGEDEKVVHRVKGHRWSDERQLRGTRDAESQNGAERHLPPLGDRMDHW